jgi:hypothetical protein
MKSRADCDCLCHSRGIVLHVVQCCDGIASLLPKKADTCEACADDEGKLRESRRLGKSADGREVIPDARMTFRLTRISGRDPG